MNKTKKFLVLLKLTVRWSETVNGKYNLEIIKYVLNKDIFLEIYIFSDRLYHIRAAAKEASGAEGTLGKAVLRCVFRRQRRWPTGRSISGLGNMWGCSPVGILSLPRSLVLWLKDVACKLCLKGSSPA